MTQNRPRHFPKRLVVVPAVVLIAGLSVAMAQGLGGFLNGTTLGTVVWNGLPVLLLGTGAAQAVALVIGARVMFIVPATRSIANIARMALAVVPFLAVAVLWANTVTYT
jgi:hypothetical protein